ncbi:hypothetical protein TNIN_296461 [Trichonephila inaurata madagascariensis]|uniref:Uncharacterized protein n=1 Tax=Trichonephila inaurata madagascariensis TaxID=2747483 RepID=A0A8X6IVK8_9ARAC|nr:hypothetical protein TNIN_296461 [Trichonephila inaurata madagascariensis]
MRGSIADLESQLKCNENRNGSSWEESKRQKYLVTRGMTPYFLRTRLDNVTEKVKKTLLSRCSSSSPCAPLQHVLKQESVACHGGQKNRMIRKPNLHMFAEWKCESEDWQQRVRKLLG